MRTERSGQDCNERTLEVLEGVDRRQDGVSGPAIPASCISIRRYMHVMSIGKYNTSSNWNEYILSLQGMESIVGLCRRILLIFALPPLPLAQLSPPNLRLSPFA